MSKRVELSHTAYKSMLGHRFISEEALIGIALHCPLEERSIATFYNARPKISLNRSQPMLGSPSAPSGSAKKIGHLQSETCLVNLGIFVMIVTNQSRDDRSEAAEHLYQYITRKWGKTLAGEQIV
jgi:hypothetical protein